VDTYEISGRPSVKGKALREWLPSQLKSNPDLTLAEHCEAFEEGGVKVSEATMSRNIARVPGECPLKKSKVAQERDEGARGLWRWLVRRFDVRRLVFVDESGMHTLMDRLRSRALRGERAYGKVTRNRGKNTALIASMSLHGMGEAMCVEGTTAADTFEVYVEHFLAPTLKKGRVVVLDNLGAHRPQKIRELLEARGAELVFLPSYSADLNPIEEAFSKIKNILRKLGARTGEALIEAISEAVSAVTLGDAAGWFNHCGYEVEVQYL
jgi:transposase